MAFKVIEVPLAAVAELRAGPDPEGSPPLPKRFLRHTDEQSVVAVRAVQECMAAIADIDCRTHGVIAAPCQTGRIASSRTLSQYAEGGGVTVSPQIVPQASLHAMAASVSVGLGMHGPSLGVGGGVTAFSEALLTLAALADTPGVDGWWLVTTQFLGEPHLDADGLPQASASETSVEAVALLVAPHASATTCPPQWWLDPATVIASDEPLSVQVRQCLVAADAPDGEQKEAA